MANHESVLYILEKTHRVTRKVTQRLVYRTRAAAIEDKVKRQNKENAKSTSYEWYRRRAVWGPDNVG